MAALPQSTAIAVVGAGAMGSGIAQVAAAAGHRVLLFDAKPGAAAKGIEGIGAALDKVVGKGKMTQQARDALVGRITACARVEDMSPAGLAIEAVVEDMDVKRKVFSDLETHLQADAILASNTSSLPLTAIGARMRHPERLVGMHFFNPAPLMALVEVVSGLATRAAVAETVYDTALAWGKSPVHAKSTPGFIVNRVARPFYAEALRVLHEGGASFATIDAVMREAGGFRMGPFELMDLIGHDVNFAVTRSVFEAYFNDPRFLPSLIQQELVEAGWLGRKTGRGFYNHAAGADNPKPATAPAAPMLQGIAVEGDLGLAEPLIGLLEKAGVPISRNPGKPDGSGAIVMDGGVLMMTDGRTATARAAAEGPNDLILFDLALDFTAATRVAIAPADQASPRAVANAAGLFEAMGKRVSVVDDLPGLVVMRTVCMLANEAADAVNQGVANAADVDVAMTKGVNYPLGPLNWAQRIGLERVLGVLDALADWYGEDRYRASPLLRRKVIGGTGFDV